jgi:hypothetical protein
MKRRDGRSISHEALEEIRIRAVQRVEAGESFAVCGEREARFQIVRAADGP